MCCIPLANWSLPCRVDQRGPLPLLSSNGQASLYTAQSLPCMFHYWVPHLKVTVVRSMGQKRGAPCPAWVTVVVSTLQVTLVGSNGREYLFLAKPKDDLRKDVRIMEVAGVLNRLFAKEPASRRRNLYLRRYSMACFGGSCSWCTRNL